MDSDLDKPLTWCVKFEMISRDSGGGSVARKLRVVMKNMSEGTNRMTGIENRAP